MLEICERRLWSRLFTLDIFNARLMVHRIVPGVPEHGRYSPPNNVKVHTSNACVRPLHTTMFSKRALSFLTSSECQLVRLQWLQSGQCVRCFHASMRQRTGNASRSGDGNNSPAIAEQAAPPDCTPCLHHPCVVCTDRV